MQFIAQNGKIVIDNSMTKAEADARLARMKRRLEKMKSDNPRKTTLAARIQDLEAEIAEI